MGVGIEAGRGPRAACGPQFVTGRGPVARRFGGEDGAEEIGTGGTIPLPLPPRGARLPRRPCYGAAAASGRSRCAGGPGPVGL